MIYLRNGDYGNFTESTNNDPWSRYYVERNNWITYKASDGCTPMFSGISIRNQNKNTDASGRSYLIFDGITISAGSVGIAYTSYINFLNCSFSAPTVSFDGATKPWYVADNHKLINAVSASNITVKDCTFNKGFRAIGTSGICENWIIDNVIIKNMCEIGIMSGVDNCTIEDSSISAIGTSSEGGGGWPIHGTIAGTFDVGEEVIQDFTGATGRCYRTISGAIYIYQTSLTSFSGANTITGQTNGGTVTNVTKYDTIHSDAVFVSGGNDVIIRRNRVNTRSQGVSIYCSGNSSRYQIENNLIYGDRPIGDYLIIEGVTDCNIVNNTIYGTIGCGVRNTHNYTVSVTNIYNNVFPLFGVDADRSGYTARVINHGGNIFGNNPNNTGGTYKFIVNETEKVSQNLSTGYFVDCSGNNYQLVAGSPATNWGNVNYQPGGDLLGRIRDASHHSAGCYEYGSDSSSMREMAE